MSNQDFVRRMPGAGSSAAGATLQRIHLDPLFLSLLIRSLAMAWSCSTAR